MIPSLKNNSLFNVATTIISEDTETLEESTNGSFYRLPSHIIKNELYDTSKNFNTLVKALNSGDDFNMAEWNAVIKSLSNIKREAKQFKLDERVPLSFT